MKLQLFALFVFLAMVSYSLSEGEAPTSTGTSTQKQPTKRSPTKASNGTAKANSTSTTTQKQPKKTTKVPTGRKPVEKTTHAPSTTHGNGTKPPPKPEIPCEKRNDSCSACLKGDGCVYCNSDHSCRKKKGSFLPTGCKGNHWYWKQCKILGNVLIIVIPTVGGVLLIMLGCCIYCCCCRRCSRNRAAEEETRQQQRRLDRRERNAERSKNRQARHDAIKMKYGLLQNMDDDDTISA